VSAVTFPYNQRQYQLMLDRISQYERGKLRIGSLIDDLWALLSVLENATTTWRESFVAEWGDLEQVYAVALDRNRDLDAEDDAIIASALAALKSLIAQVIEPDDGDDAFAE
jgi:hypothetical protein